MVLDRDLGELLESGAIFAGMLHADMGEDRRHGGGAYQSFRFDAGSAATAKKSTPHLFDTNAQHDIVHVGLDRDIAFAKGRRAGRTSVGAIDDGDARLTDELQDTLPDPTACLSQVAAIERLHVFHCQATVIQRHQRDFRAETRHRPLGKPTEPDHVRTDDIDPSHRSTALASGGSKNV